MTAGFVAPADRVFHSASRPVAGTRRVGGPQCGRHVDGLRVHAGSLPGTFAKLLAAIGVEVVVCIGKRPISIDTEREQLRDVLGRHFPPHWELEPVVWLDRWWGWWRKHPNVRQFPPQYRYWERRPPDWDYLVARRWEDAT